MRSLSQAIKEDYAGTYPYPYRRPNPSNLGSCRRYIWYQVYLADALLPLPAELQLLFEEGRRQEEFCIDLIEKKFKVSRISSEPSSNMKGPLGKYSVYGRPDVLVDVDDIWYMTEIKSINEGGFLRMRQMGLAKAYPNYYDQIMSTLILVAEGMPDVSPEGAYLFVRCRDNGDIHDEYIPWNPDWVEVAIGNLDKRAVDLSDRENPPERPYMTPTDFHCQTCPARDECWKLI
ncbi:MAG: hypothetical protein FVQ79_12150 [Planctomycetes bacterium]|nr:hypothetical protein [Planctomycetota bacterium]